MRQASDPAAPRDGGASGPCFQAPMWHRLRRKTCYFLPKTCDLRPRLVGGGRGLEQPRPLAIGIGKLIQGELASSLPSWAISAAIGAHTRSHGYLKALAD